jgi:hypothetical protein
MMYHFFKLSMLPSFGLGRGLAAENETYAVVDNHVHYEQKESEKEHRRNHDQRGTCDFPATRPGDVVKLFPCIRQKIDKVSKRLLDLL